MQTFADTPARRRRHEGNRLAELIDHGPYFTDDVRLFRLTGVVSGSNGPRFVELEDCRTLDIAKYTAEEVEAVGLVPVSARPAGEDAGSRQPPPRGTASTGAGLERTSPEETPPSSTLRTGP